MSQIDYKHANQVLKSSQGYTLYIGDISAAEDIAWLKQANIKTGELTHIQSQQQHQGLRSPMIQPLNISPMPSKIGRAKILACTSTWAPFRSINVLLPSRRSKKLECASPLRSRSFESIFVISQSATLVIAFLIKYKSMPFLAALKLLKSKRPQICPNLGFQLQLKAYERQLHKIESASLMMKKEEKKQLPEIIKFNPSSTDNKAFHRKAKDNMRILNRSMKSTETKQHKQFEYLKKIAEFRFGITNMSRWKISDLTSQNFKRIYQQ